MPIDYSNMSMDCKLTILQNATNIGKVGGFTVHGVVLDVEFCQSLIDNIKADRDAG